VHCGSGSCERESDVRRPLRIGSLLCGEVHQCERVYLLRFVGGAMIHLLMFRVSGDDHLKERVIGWQEMVL